jgi:putative endonuclease
MEHDKGTKSVWPGIRMSKDQERSWVCYILRCGDDTLYCGITIDLEKRLAAHNQGSAAKYTRARGLVELVFMESCADKSAALKREMEIKSLSRTKKLALIESARK